MEAFRRNRSEIGGFTDQSSGVKCVSKSPASREGKKQTRKHKSFAKFVPESSSCHSGASGEEKVISLLETRSLCHKATTPIKSLLAYEMAKEQESKRRAPGIIARLMGLDGLPPQNHGHTRHKSAENYQWRVKSARKDCTYQDHHSFRKPVKEEQEFKDVFEVSEKMKGEGNNYSWHSTLTEAEMAFIRQKFMDAKRLSTDEKLQHSQEFYDALEALDSNKDLLLRFLQHPDSLFTKHLHDLESALPQMHCSRGPSMKSAHSSNLETTVSGHKSNKETTRRKCGRSSDKHYAVIPGHSHGKQGQQVGSNTIELLDKDLEDEKALRPTRIVVLKPNMGNTLASDRCFSSPLSSDDYRADSRLPCTRKRDSELWGKMKTPEDVSLARHNSGESREVAKKVTRKIRASWNSGSFNHPVPGFRGYAGDESSSDLSESDSMSEAEVVNVPSRPRNRNRNRSWSSSSTESSVSKEAKKRLSERWKLTHKPEAVGKVSRSSTLAEMLAISEREGRPANFNGDIFEEGFGRRIEDRPMEWTEPIGISSRDGWRNGCLAKSRSLPSSVSSIGGPRRAMRQDIPRDDWMMMSTGMPKRERSKPVKGNKERFLSRNSRSRARKPQSSCCTQNEGNIASPEICLGPNQEKLIFCKDLSFEDDLITSVMQADFPVAVYSDSKSVANTEHKNITITPESSHLESASPILSSGKLSPNDRNASQKRQADQPKETGHPSAPEEQAAASAKESDQPSPVSVLEPSFSDDLSSSSECFESLSADLHGLRMQLHLLKLERGSYEGAPMLVSSDEDADNEGNTDLAVLSPGAEADWKSSYLVDVLAKANFNDADPDSFMATWHSSESPVSPTVFEQLEKKYSNLTSASRSRRKFVFDSINSELLQIFQQLSDPHPWVRPGRMGPKWDIHNLQSTLHKLIMTLDVRASKDSVEEILKIESQWLALGDEIETIGREIEALLTNELLAEIVAI